MFTVFAGRPKLRTRLSSSRQPAPQLLPSLSLLAVLKIIGMEVAPVETLLLAVDHACRAFEFLVLLFARTLLATRLSVLILDHILDVLPMLFVVSLFDFGEFAYATVHAAVLAISSIVVKIFIAAPMLSEVWHQTFWALSFAIVRELCR